MATRCDRQELREKVECHLPLGHDGPHINYGHRGLLAWCWGDGIGYRSPGDEPEPDVPPFQFGGVR